MSPTKYAAALRADDEYQEHLIRVYGKDGAPAARYLSHHADAACDAARAAKLEADADMLG